MGRRISTRLIVVVVLLVRYLLLLLLLMMRGVRSVRSAWLRGRHWGCASTASCVVGGGTTVLRRLLQLLRVGAC